MTKKKRVEIGGYSVRKQGDMVRLIMYTAHDSHNKFFDMEAPANSPKKIRALIEAAISKGMCKPVVRGDEEKWW